MEKKKNLCPVCKKTKNEDVFLMEKHDMIVCPKCQLSIIIKGKSPLGRYRDNWKKSSEELFPILRPPLYQDFLGNPKLYFLYEDCYYSLLIGRYNASIVLMGVLLEAIMKERIELKLGKDFRGAYGPCLQIIKENRLMDVKDIRFLTKIKDNVRNPYQHVDDKQILRGIFVPVWPFQFKEISFKRLEKAIKSAKSGQLKPRMLPAADIPALRPVVKQTLDRERAIGLFNQVYDFLLDCKIKYFRQEEYDEHHKKFKTGLEKVEHYEM